MILNLGSLFRLKSEPNFILTNSDGDRNPESGGTAIS